MEKVQSKTIYAIYEKDSWGLTYIMTTGIFDISKRSAMTLQSHVSEESLSVRCKTTQALAAGSLHKECKKDIFIAWNWQEICG